MDLEKSSRFGIFFIKAGWAPLSVILLHSLLASLIEHNWNLDPAMHFLGGAALAFFWNQIIRMRSDWFGAYTNEFIRNNSRSWSWLYRSRIAVTDNRFLF